MTIIIIILVIMLLIIGGFGELYEKYIERLRKEEMNFLCNVNWGEGTISSITDEEIEKTKKRHPNESNVFICGKILWYRNEARKINGWIELNKILNKKVCDRFNAK